MKYRVFKERRLFRPYKIQTWLGNGQWSDCGRVKRLAKDHGVFITRYYWTKRGALKVIRQDCQAEGIFDE